MQLIRLLSFFAVLVLATFARAEVHDGSLADPNLSFIGRWDKSDAKVYHSYWVGAYVRTDFTGTEVSIQLANDTQLLVSIDGEKPRTVGAEAGVSPLHTKPLAAGRHTLLVGSAGQTAKQTYELAFQGLKLAEGGETLPTAPRPIIEFVGDSITAGGGGGEELPLVVNYAWLTGEALQADHTQIAFYGRALTSGFGCDRDKTGLDVQYFRLKDFYHLADKPQTPWSFSYSPKIVVINLGQNDLGCSWEPAAKFAATYNAFIRNIRAKLPVADIVAMRPFGGAYADEIAMLVAEQRAAGDKRVHYVDTTGWLERADFLDGVHPNEAGHAKAAERLSQELKELPPPDQSAVPPPSQTPAKIVVNGNTSTAIDIKIVKVGQEVPETYSGKLFAASKGFTFYVSEHYALKSQMDEAFSRHILEVSELAYPHWVEMAGVAPADPNKRMAIIYAADLNHLNRAIADDTRTGWYGGGGGITLWNNLAAYNYPSGTLKYHKRALVIHENLHMLQAVAGTGTMGTECFTYAGEQHVYDETKKQLTVANFDHAPMNNWSLVGLTEQKNPESYVSIQDFFAKGRWYRGAGDAVFMQFFWSDPDRLMKWRLLRDEFYATQFASKPMLTAAEEIFGPLGQLEADWQEWLSRRRATFRHVDWGWEQSGNVMWAYGFPWNPNLWSQMDILYAPNEKVEYDPLRMDYPAEPMPPTVGPVERGVEEPSVGYTIYNVGGGCWGGFGLGVEDRDLCKVIVVGNRALVIDGSSFGMERKEVPLTAEVNAAAAQNDHHYGVTIKIKKKELEVTVRGGKADGVKEMKTSAPINEAQRERLISKHMAMIGRNGYPAITPWIDDGRRPPHDLTKPAPANLWRYAGLDPLFTLYRAAHLLKDKTPKSLLSLKDEMLAAATQDEAAQHKAEKAYDDRLAAIVRDVEKCNADAETKGLALAALAGVTTRLAVRAGKEPNDVVMEVQARGLLQDEVKGTVNFASDATESIPLLPYQMQSVTQTRRLENLNEPKTLTANLNLSWRDLEISAPLSATAFETSVPKWWIIGPFHNPGGHGADVKHPIETEKLDLAKKYPGERGEIAWRKVQRDPQVHLLSEHLVDLLSLLGQRDEVAGYALVWIDSDQPRDALLAVGSDDGVVVWLNDKQVHQNLVPRGYSSKQDRIPIHLEKGRNKLLLKVTQGIGSWNFSAHLISKDGGYVPGVSYSLD